VSGHLHVPSTIAGQEMSSSQSSREGPTFTEMNELSVDAFVEQVLARNPSLTQMMAAWQAASARYPQVSSLDDPMVGATIAPASIGSNDVEFGYRLEVSQKLPFSGKLGIRGQSAQAEAAAAGNEVDDMRLQLIESAKSSFYEYFLVVRSIAVNEENLRLLKSFREEARTRYEKTLVPQQDVSQADVELGRQQERGLTLARMRKVSVARLNTLMHMPPDTPLPPPPGRLNLGEPLPAASVLRSHALSQRPDLLAFSNRLVADEASLRLAQQEYYPDFEVMAAYDTIMGNGPTRDLAAQVGVRMNLPLRKERRHAAVAEAQARIAERRAQLESRIDQVNLQLQEAYEQVVESAQVVRLYEKTIMPAAERNVADARSAYETARIPFLSLIEAQRNRVGLRDRYYEALADYFRRMATLERVVGGPLVLAADERK
jgi:outer membrane protein TolC